MSFPPTVNRFKGTDWEECNEFILAIRAAAWKEGKFRDLAWMADFAALHLSHNALSWHSRLPQDVCEDWKKLQVALLDRWPPPKDDDKPRIEPTPAAAPSLGRNDRADRSLNGILKVVIDGTNTISYIKFSDGDLICTLTDKATKALRIRCNSLSHVALLERIDGSRHSWLGVHWDTTAPNVDKESNVDGRLVLVESPTLKSSWKADRLHQLASCTLSADSELVPVWENGDTSKITIGIFVIGGFLYLAVNPDAYSKRFPDQKSAKIFFEQIG